MATEKNDLKILELKKKIEDKKRILDEKRFKFFPYTNCVLIFDDLTYNLNVLKEENLVHLMIKLNMYKLSAQDLHIKNPIISGYNVEEWILDIKNKLSLLSIKKEESDLKVMESKLDKLLSEDKKTELEIDEISSLLI